MARLNAHNLLVRMGLLLLLVSISLACRWAAFGISRLLDRVSFPRVAPAVHG